MSGVDGGECDAPIKITWPSDVENLKKRVNTIAESTDLDVKSCIGLTLEEQKSWVLFITQWRNFNAQKTGWFGTHGEWVTACSYAHLLDAWREKIKTKCKLSAPENIKGAEWESFKWLAGGVIAIAGVTALIIYAPEIKALLPSRK